LQKYSSTVSLFPDLHGFTGKGLGKAERFRLAKGEGGLRRLYRNGTYASSTGPHTCNQDIDKLPCRNPPSWATADARATGKCPQKIERVHRQADFAG
jgi:hypothetical protein